MEMSRNRPLPEVVRYVFFAVLFLACSLPTAASAQRGYGMSVYGGSWAAVHRDNRNSDYAPVPVAASYASGFETVQENQRTINRPVIGPAPASSNGVNVYYTIIGKAKHGYAHLFIGKDGGTGKTVIGLGRGKVEKHVTVANALIDSDGSFYLADDRKVMKYSPAGIPLWARPTFIAGIQPTGPQFTPDGKLLIMSWNGWVYVIEPANGDILWKQDMTPSRSYPDELPNSCVANGDSGDCAFANAPAVDPTTDTVYQTFINENGETCIQEYAYDASSHSLTLKRQSGFLEGGSASSITLSWDYRTLYVNDSDNHLMAYDVDNLTAPLWSVDIGYTPQASPVVDPDGFMVPNGSYKDPNFRIEVFHDNGYGAEKVFQNDAYVPISSPAAGLNDRFVVIACKKDAQGNRGAMGLLVFDPGGIISFTPWKDECLTFPVTLALGGDGSVYVVGSGSVGLKKFSPVFSK